MPRFPITPVLCVAALAAQADDCFRIESIRLPAGSPPEVGGIDFAPDGTLFMVLRRGDVFRATPVDDPQAFDWELFATGFHNGCGIDALSRDRIRITQMAEMTEAHDSDGDGRADDYRVFASGWGLSGNYHETNALTGDGAGGYFLAIGTASHNGPVFEHTLGTFSPAGRRGRNFSSVKWKGWILHADEDGTLSPVASGFRMPNGIYRDPDGELWSGDNQGDWKATTPLYHIEKGNFYGHPSTLVWDESWTKSDDPLDYYRDHLEEYNEDRTYAAVEVPHSMNRSVGEPMEVPRDGSFGPFAGQLLLPDNNGQQISRVMREEVDGVFQGAVTQFIQDNALRSGNHRLRFSPDHKQLYVGQTVRGWGQLAEGLQRITWTGEEPFDIDQVSLTVDGFRFTFTQEVPEELADPALWELESYTYQPRWTYGSPPENRREHELERIPHDDPRVLEWKVEGLEAGGRVYEFGLPEVADSKGRPLRNRRLCYTVNRLR